MCTSDVCRELGIGNEHGTRLFDDKWLEEARKIIELERERNERRKQKVGSLGAS